MNLALNLSRSAAGRPTRGVRARRRAPRSR